MKVSELTGAQLDYWVAKVEGFMRPRIEGGVCVVDQPDGLPMNPSTDWAHGGPIIERQKIMVTWNADHWISGANDAVDNPKSRIWSGRTALIAAMRAHVASKFGDEVPD